MSTLRFYKVEPLLSSFRFCGSSAPSKAIGWSNISSVLLGLLLQPQQRIYLAFSRFLTFKSETNLVSNKKANLVSRVFSAFHVAAGRGKTLAHSRSLDQICPSRMDKYAFFFKMAAKNKVREIWVRQLPTKEYKLNGVPRGEP